MTNRYRHRYTFDLEIENNEPNGAHISELLEAYKGYLSDAEDEHETTIIHTPEGEVLCECGNCELHFLETPDLSAISDLAERLDPGGPVPACECPDCGSLAYLVD